MLGCVSSYLLSDERLRLRRPTLEDALRQYGISPVGQGS